jgi:hypothetical protein
MTTLRNLSVVLCLAGCVGNALAQGGTGLRDEPSAIGLRSGLDTRSLAKPSTDGTGLGLASSGLVLADWHPLASGFRVTGGFAYNNPQLDAFNSAARAGAGIYDTPTAGTSSVRSLTARSNPYLGLGWGIAPTPRSGLYFSADVGVMYQRSGGGACSIALPPTLCAQLQNDVRLDEEQRQSDTRLAPVLTLGVGLRF